MPLPINRYRLPDAPAISTSTVKKSRKIMILILTFVLGYVYINYYSSVVDEFEESAKDVQIENSMDTAVVGLEEQYKGGFDSNGHLNGHSNEETNVSGNEDTVTFNLDGTIEKDDLDTSNGLGQESEENETMGESDEEEEADEETNVSGNEDTVTFNLDGTIEKDDLDTSNGSGQESEENETMGESDEEEEAAQDNGDGVNEENTTENNQEGEEETAEESEIGDEEEANMSDGSSTDAKDEVSQEEGDIPEDQHNESDGAHETEPILEEEIQNDEEGDSNEEDFDGSNEDANTDGDEIENQTEFEPLSGEDDDKEPDQVDEDGSTFENEERDETLSDEEHIENSVDDDEDGDIENNGNGIEESAEDDEVTEEDTGDETENQTEAEQVDTEEVLDEKVNEEEVDEQDLNEAEEGSDEEQETTEEGEDVSEEGQANEEDMEACSSNPFADTLDKTFADIVSTLTSSVEDTTLGEEVAETIQEFSSSTVDKTFLREVDEENEGSRRQNLRGRSRRLDEDADASEFDEDETSAANEEEMEAPEGTESISVDTVSVRCTTEPEFSILEGICGLESHMLKSSTESEEKAECNYMITSTGTAESTSDEDDEIEFIKKLLEETRCNIYVTHLCSADEDSSSISLEQTDERLHLLENTCIEPRHDSESIDSIVDVERRLENDNEFELPQIDLLYVNDKATVMDELVDSFLNSSKMTIKSPDNESIANLPMQLVFNNVSNSDTLKQNVYDKTLKSGYISIAPSTISAEESKHLTLMRFYCPGPSAPLMQQFVGGGFPV